MTLLGYSVPETITDDDGNALKGATIAVTGPSSYAGVAVTDETTGVLRLGPLPIGEYTVTYGARSATVVVLPTPADLQAAYDAALGAAPSDDLDAEVAALASADAAEASARAAADTAEAAARAAAVAAEAVLRAATDATDDSDDSAEVAARQAADEAEATARAAADSAESAARAALDAREAANNAAQATAIGDEATARAAAVTAEAAARSAADSALQSSITANTTAIGQRLIAVDHGSVAGTARPTSTLPVKWFGTVAPDNKVTNDEWYDRTTELLKRWDGSAWKPAGSGTYAPVVSTGLRRVRTRSAAPSRPDMRRLQTRVARYIPGGACRGTSTNSLASIPNVTSITVALDGTKDHLFTYYGSVAWQSSASGWGSLDPHSTTYNVPWVLETCTDSPIFAVEMTAGSQNVELLVDGEQVKPTSKAVAGGSYWPFDWNSVRKARRYTFRGQGGMAIKSFRMNAVDSLWAPKRDDAVKAAWLGDSYSQVVGSDALSTIPMLACDMLGWRVAASVEGATGYDQPNPATTVASFAARVTDVIAAAPDVVILAGGHNIRDTSTEQASAIAVIQAIQAGLPGVPILVFGPFMGSNQAATYAPETTRLQAAVSATNSTANPVTFLDTTGWITGTGKVGTTTNDGNADVLISSDGVHPQTGVGGDYFAARCAEAIVASAAI